MSSRSPSAIADPGWRPRTGNVRCSASCASRKAARVQAAASDSAWWRRSHACTAARFACRTTRRGCAPCCNCRSRDPITRRRHLPASCGSIEMAEPAATSLGERLGVAPVVHDRPQAARVLADLGERVRQDASLAPLAGVLDAVPVGELLAGIFGASPFLTALIERDPARLLRLLAVSPEARFEELCREVSAATIDAGTLIEAMRSLRVFKNEVALLTALCDLGGVWPVMSVARRLSQAADAAVAAAVRFLFRQARGRGDWLASEPDGYIVLAMGKYGACELNYSSDIDLIVFYDLARVHLRQGLEVQTFFVRLTRDLVRLLHERTGEGYVFRSDLRLRPDPGSTPLALSTEAALNYYESFGQNWERAALIKARAVAGDLAAGAALLQDLAPFIWRKYLDFAAIADIHAMKRQIHAYRSFGSIGVAGHNIKLGRGGIREIEFFVQTQQLIAGGRQRELRIPQTIEALDALAARGWIKPEVRDELRDCYRFLRGIEHRLQMIRDEQTHEVPEGADELLSFARFAGYPSVAAFADALIPRLEAVQRHYAALFEDMPELTRGTANMVFAGARDDPQTLAALSEMGYSQPEQVVDIIRGWHHGRYPAVRSAKARERLTEVQAVLVEALAATANPDAAFASFDRFLSELPSGV